MYEFYQSLRVMRITILLLIVGFFHVNAHTTAQEISIQGENISLQEVFSMMRQQTNYDFLFDLSTVESVAPIRHLQIDRMSLTDALTNVLKNTPLKFTVLAAEKSVVVSRRKPPVVSPKNYRQQDTTILRGMVVDENGNSLAGATVYLRGSNRKVQTDASGKFIIRNAPADAAILVTYVGYQGQQVTMATLNQLGGTLTLIRDEQELKAVNVVLQTGYQTLRKDQLTGAASVISGRELEQRTIVSGNLLESLEGRLPGLVYNHRNPNVAEDEQLTIRGVSTFDGVKKPLIVIDGFPTETDLNAINPNDIASVSVLRDAAASTIYGARAANGVIVIETKKGQQGKPRLSFRASAALQPTPDFGSLGYSRSDAYVNIKRSLAEASTSSRPSPTGTQQDPVTSIIYDLREGLITDSEADSQLEALKQYNNLNDYHALFYQPSLMQNYELFLDGGSEYNTYRLGVNYVDDRTSEKQNQNDRLMLTLHDTYRMSDRFTFNFQGAYTHENTQAPGEIPNYASLVPYEPLIGEDGEALPDYNRLTGAPMLNDEGITLGLFDRWRRPYQDYATEHNRSSRNTFRGQGRLHAKIIDGLSVEVGGAYENSQTSSNRLVGEQNFLLRDLLNRSAQVDPSTGMAMFTHVPQGDLLQRSVSGIEAYTIRAQANADFTFGAEGKHNIAGIIGAEMRRTERKGNLASFFGYDGQSLLSSPIDLQLLSTRTITSGFPDLRFGTASLNIDQYFNEDYDDRRFRSLYGQATYLFDSRYTLTGSIRLDQSNLFGTDPRYRNKPQWSAGAAWNIHQESFMEPLSDWLNELKLRAAYGLTGNVPTSNSGRFLIFRTYRRAALIPAASYNSIYSPENQALRWENTSNLNLGGDFSLFNNRLGATVDWYRKHTVDILATTPADPTTGWASYRANTAEVENKGFEIGLHSRNMVRPDFSWTTTLTGSFNQNNILDVYIANPSGYRNGYFVNASTPVAGYPLNALLSYRYAGLDADGIPTMINQNGEIQKISGSDQILLEDLVNSGTTTPRHVIGFGNLFRWGPVDFFAMVMYYGGHVSRVEQPDIYATFPLQGAENYWRNPGDETTTQIPGLRPVFGDPNYSAYSFGRAIYSHATQYVRRADQLRLTDLSLTWHIPSAVLERLRLQNAQIRLQGQNLWRWTFSDNDIDMDAIDPVSGVRALYTKPIYSISIFTQF